ncbi:MAG: LuxR family transcriptional regulator [Thalassobium sp.]|uniref:Response regulator transcription factor n=1 Tax=Thalassolituus pacificus TaxID=2975440 RepID=A0A9X2WH40_9GAMM|nr:response regulator transcription factor [Thalassolituus pacificus]MCT7360268.1 response regulator transcription factor [Thalassolituus pacificus]PHS62455.1 MAG: LuxR family transcriptional regulator [Thalassobium sp.]
MKILLVDDHQMFVDGLKGILSASDLNAEIETVNNGRAALERMRSVKFDIALVDLRLPIMDGFMLLAEMNKCVNLTPIIIVSASRDPEDMRKAIELGAMSFIPKSSSGDRIVQTIADVMNGKVVYSNKTDINEEDFLSDGALWAAQHNMTPRQLEVLRLVKKGLSNQAIAEQLCLSVATVKSHLSAIFHALGAQSRSESSKKAHQLGLD